jgi:hypothetical protein
MSLKEILDTAKSYYIMGTEHAHLTCFPNFTASTTESEEFAMIDKAIAEAEMNNPVPANAKVMELCKAAQHVFLLAYREGLQRCYKR